MPKVSIIILNWNQPKLTVNCVNSVLKQGYKDFEILLIDNHSEDDSFETLKNIFGKNKKIRLFQTEKNIGYAGGNNFGVKKCKGEYVVILNNDTVVDKNWLNVLVTVIQSDKTIAAASANERLNGKKDPLNYSKEARTSTVLQYTGRYDLKNKPKKQIIDLFAVRGSSFIIRKRLVSSFFDEDYFSYGEDVYLGWLLRLKGYRNVIALDAGLDHFHKAVQRSNLRFFKYLAFLGERNRWLNFFLFFEKKNIWKLLPFMFASYLFMLFEPRKTISRLRVLPWFIKNIHTVKQKRKQIQKQRKVSDTVLFSKMSPKFYEPNLMNGNFSKSFMKCFNFILKKYLKLLRIKTIDDF